MMPTRILVDTFVDADLTNAQMSNAREIIARLCPEKFHVTTFRVGSPDPRIERRPNTCLIRIGKKHQSIPLLKQYLFGRHELIFYLKASPAMKAYMRCRLLRGRRGLTIGTIESQMNLRTEPTISPANVALFEKTVLRADHLYSNSPFVAESLERNYGRESKVIPTGVDTKFFAPVEAKKQHPRPKVLFVGSLRPFKGPDVVLEAAKCFPNADFTIVGDGVMAESLRGRALEIKNVTLTGPLHGRRVLERYQQSDIFLFPSHWEGSPKVIAEAAACALPVIARKAYKPETVADGITGFLVGDDEELFKRLSELLDEPEKCREMGRCGREHILKFDWDLVVRQWEEVFTSLTGGRDV
jgi:glycosyltransferase involved in cell wall biosynthesis